MSELFLKIINMSISASWLVLAVLALRFLLQKAPKWINVLLWGIVAVRLICPFSIESALSLIPSAETIPLNIGMNTTPVINSGINAINNAVNPIISQSNMPMAGASANPLQLTIGIYELIWLLGVTVLTLYTLISYVRLRHKVCEAVLLRGNIYQSERVCSPFVLGILRPRIYLPYSIGGPELEHVLAHEQAHIRRRDHWWKPLGFLLLTIHWFNPLMWLAYILLCRDIELACDERVIRELNNEQRADYTQALVDCSVNRRLIAACPLAFGEVGVKTRVRSVMNYKKPAFWLIILAIAACAVVAVCFLTNPKAEQEFPINGHNISELDTMQIIDKISKAENLDDGSLLCVNPDNFDLTLTSGFDWASDGAIRFFYTSGETTYSAQLRMFHDTDKFFITERTKWAEQKQVYKLFDYLNALKYMPQAEIQALSPDADGYSVSLVSDGAPGDYSRALMYSSDGIENIDGWYIHLLLHPLHETNGAYTGRGDEAIHLFYGLNTAAADAAAPLDSAISNAILEHYADSASGDLIHVESHVILAQEDTADSVTVYLLALQKMYRDNGGELEENAASYIPTVLTFSRSASGEYTLEDYWEPGDGSVYADDIRNKFPDVAAEEALNAQTYIDELDAQCRAKALDQLALVKTQQN